MANKIKICLDAGHYGKYNQSPVVKEYYESDMTWKLTNLQKKYLEQYEGVEVVLTRTSQEKDLALASRGATSKGCNVFISNHSNASSSESATYIVIIHLRDDNKTTIDETSKAIAKVMGKAISSVMGYKYQLSTRASSNDRDGNGYKDDEYYGVLQGAKVVGTPAMILEHGFHTNKATAQWLLQDSNLEKLAKAEAEALAKYFGCVKKSSSNGTSTGSSAGNATQETSTLKAGEKLILSNAKAYSSSDAKTSYGTKSGTFYTWSDKVENERIRITDSTVNVGKSGQVTCWINVADAKVSESTSSGTMLKFNPYQVRVTITNLRIRKGPGTNYDTTGKYTGAGVFTIVGEKEGWGLLKSYESKRDGWISLKYATKL